MTNGLMMDRAGKKLQRLHSVIEWLLYHWNDFPEGLHQLVEDENVPLDVKAYLYDIVKLVEDEKVYLYDIVKQDFANAITPAIEKNWRVVAESEGVGLPD